MSSKPYTPRRDSLASQLVGFFTQNPDETLTLDDITDKFDYTRGNIHTLVADAKTAGLLKLDRDEDGEYVYSAGARLAAYTAAEDQPSAPLPKPAPKPAPSSGQPRLHLDLDSLTVEEGIPYLPTARVGESKWQPLFDKLTRPNQSVAVPGHVKAAIGAAILKRAKEKKKGTFRVAKTGPGQARVWRVA